MNAAFSQKELAAPQPPDPRGLGEKIMGGLSATGTALLGTAVAHPAVTTVVATGAACYFSKRVRDTVGYVVKNNPQAAIAGVGAGLSFVAGDFLATGIFAVGSVNALTNGAIGKPIVVATRTATEYLSETAACRFFTWGNDRTASAVSSAPAMSQKKNS